MLSYLYKADLARGTKHKLFFFAIAQRKSGGGLVPEQMKGPVLMIFRGEHR
jgi:hypothetical protein